MRVQSFLLRLDWILLCSVILLTGLGLAMLYSISVGREGGDLTIFWRQLSVALGGLLVLIIVGNIHSRSWESLAKWLYLGILLVLMAVLFFGETINATRGWLSVAGIRVQPVEFAKVVMIIALASFLARRARELDRIRNLFISFILTVGLTVPILLQPDFGSAAILLALWLCMVLVIGVKREYLIGLSILGLGGLVVAWLFLFQPYQRERLLAFFFPSERVTTQNYNVKQAIIAVGSGGLLGRGLGAGSQSQLRFLPEASTDFMFATLAEELGFAGVLVACILLGLILMRLFLLLLACDDWFSSFIILGTIILLIIEVFMNAGMNLGLFPVVGIPFPFLSVGGSSLLAHLFLVGLVQSIARLEKTKGYRGSDNALI